MTTLLPPNATPLQLALEAASAAIRTVPVPLRTLHDPQTCPLALLPWLAWARQVDVWDPAWPEARQRAVVAAMPAIHRTRGTVGAVRRAMAAHGFPCTYVGWRQAGLPRGTFALRTAAGAAFAPSDLTTLRRVIDSAKALRSHLAALTLTETAAAAPLFAGISVRMVHHHAAGMALIPSAADPAATPDICAGVLTVSRVTL
ncbi:phage tail protein I [Novispirillum itersonii]|uniref:phage tail protein I n=1 Tax=Novispirillum itersonii TaxID=189 RepID=UPI00035E9AAB|nr:phage tail protein I [Novispirillum itersonii]